MKLGMKDSRNWKVYRLVQMPALRAFYDMERVGQKIDIKELKKLGKLVRRERRAAHIRLMEGVSDTIKRKHADKGLKFSRDEFVRDVLFLPKKDGGFGLNPKVWTKGTTKLKDKSQRLPSVSTKPHLPFFDDNEWIREFIAYKKITKLESTYVGQRGGKIVPQRSRTAPPKYTEPKGVWKYLDDYNRLHSNLFLHRQRQS